MRKQQSIKKSSSSVARSPRSRPRFTLPELLEGRTLLSSYVVSTSADSGVGSLRAAIASVNADSSPDTITFAIGAGVQTISPATPLPALTNTVTIDGTAPSSLPDQKIVLSGLSAGAGANGLELDAAHSVVNGLVINGFSGYGVYAPSGGADVISNNLIGTDATGTTAAANGTGVYLASNGNSVSGNLISGNSLDGVYVTGDSNTVAGNLIGTNAAGSGALANGLASFEAAGVRVVNASNTTIGGLTAAARNVISGNADDGVSFENDNALGNVVEGNYVGLDVTGTTPIPNSGNGVDIGTANNLSSSNVTVGGSAAGARNTISGNAGNGVYISGSTGNLVSGNYIGTNAAGVSTVIDAFGDTLEGNSGDGVRVLTTSGGNTISGNVLSGNFANGVYLQTTAASNTVSNNSIGENVNGVADGNVGDGIIVVSGPATLTANVIVANQSIGIELAAGGTVVTSNYIGTDSTGSTLLGNLDRGILIYSDGNQVGAVGAGNVIADNGTAGIAVISGARNSIRANAVSGNAFGIDLGNSGTVDTTGPTPNDSAGHTGPNLYQNFPVLTGATVSASGTNFVGTLTATANQSYVVDFFANTTADATGYGQGQKYVGSATVTTDSTGVAAFNVNLPFVTSTQLIFSATATDSAGNTSEFAVDLVGTVSSTSTVANTTTMLTSSADPSTFGQAVTFTATVTANGSTPTGTVTFMDGSTVLASNVPLNGNKATFTTTTPLGVGAHTITASYSGATGTFNPSTASLTQNVSKAASTTTLTSGNNPSVYLTSVTFTATVAGVAGVNPTGTVTFFDGATLLGSGNVVNGVATFSTSTLNVGSHTITALYNSDGNYTGSASNPVTQVVNAPGGSISGEVFRDKTGNGLSSDDSALSGVTVQLLTLQGGKMVVTKSTVSDANGVYAFTNLPAGTYQVQEITPTGFVETAPATQPYYTNTLSGGGVVTADNFDNYMEGCCCDGSLSNVHYVINGCRVVTNLRGQVHQGDTVQAVFTVDKGYVDTLSLVSYIAPGASFSAATASKQTIFQDSTGTFGPGTYTLKVVVPKCYFQVDFVCGYAIDKFGPAGSNVFYSAQDRLISADNGGTNAAPTH